MATKKAEKDAGMGQEAAFTKAQILLAKKYRSKKDILNVVLKEGQTYTLQQADDLIDTFMKGEVS